MQQPLIDTNELRAIANRAPQRWERSKQAPRLIQLPHHQSILCRGSDTIADYLEAFSPDVAVALLDRIEELESAL